MTIVSQPSIFDFTHPIYAEYILCYTSPDRRAKYCDDRVCLSVREHISEKYTLDLHQIFVRVTHGRRCNMSQYVLSVL